MTPTEDAADAELRALLLQVKATSRLSYEKLAEAANMSRGAAQIYITKPGNRRDTTTLTQLLTALGASERDRERALELHREEKSASRLWKGESGESSSTCCGIGGSSQAGSESVRPLFRDGRIAWNPLGHSWSASQLRGKCGPVGAVAAAGTPG
jgi:hypothetical protein